MPVAELLDRVSWVEMQHWIIWYQMEADAALPPNKRPIRARTPEEAVAALDSVVRRAKPSKNLRK